MSESHNKLSRQKLLSVIRNVKDSESLYKSYEEMSIQEQEIEKLKQEYMESKSEQTDQKIPLKLQNAQPIPWGDSSELNNLLAEINYKEDTGQPLTDQENSLKPVLEQRLLELHFENCPEDLQNIKDRNRRAKLLIDTLK